MSETIERVAKRVYAAMWPGNDPLVPWETIKNEAAKAPVYEAARGILLAMRDPDPEMIDAGRDVGPDAPYGAAETAERFRVMIDAALAEPPK